MKKLLKLLSGKSNTLLYISIFVIASISIILGSHNASLYNPLRGFDGSGHIDYVQYIYENHQIPPPTGLETHQSPLYYVISAVVLSIFQNIRSIQFVNIIVLWLIILAIALCLSKVFKSKLQVFVGVLSLAALPMLNIFPPMVTNELLNTFWIISATVSSISLLYQKDGKSYNKIFIFMIACMVLGLWTKITIISIVPTIIISLFLSRKSFKKFIVYSGITILVFVSSYIPLYIRSLNAKSPSNIAHTVSKIIIQRSPEFYYRLDWIPKVDMYNTQYYSFLGGAWNSFWSDGHNVITPFVPFHKKAFILWTLGFILFPLSLYGLWKQFRENKKVAIVMTTLGISMFIFYVLYNMISNHYSAVRLTYEMGIVLPYAFGLASAAKSKRISKLLLLLLVIQFLTMVSFYWILPWWYQAQP